jgi:hypothetical protein
MANVSNQWCAQKLTEFLKSSFKIENEDYPTDTSSLYSWSNWPSGKGGKYFERVIHPKLLYKGDIIIRDTAQDYIAVVYEGGSVSGKYKIAEGNSATKKFVKKETSGPVTCVLRARGATSDYTKPTTAPEGSFTEWFAKQGFRRFTAQDFTSYFNKISQGGVRNSEPPKEKWNNIVPTLRIVEDLCDSFGVTCVINSSYRSPAYNASTPGAARYSMHLEFKALDISFPGVRPSTVYARLKQWRDAGKWTGGLGSYPGFTHIDTRNYNTNWG